MYCKKCGKNIDETSKFCPYCGERVEEDKEDKDENVCPKCNSLRNPGDQYCYHCGYKFQDFGNIDEKGFTISTPNIESRKSKVAAALLAFFLGYIGIHDFYLGYKIKGLCKLIPTAIASILRIVITILYHGNLSTATISSPYFILGFIIPTIINIIIQIWCFIDFIMILINKVTDSDGLLLK